MKKNLLLPMLISFVLTQLTNSAYSQSFTSSNLAIVVINTHGQTIAPYVKYIVSMGIIDHGLGVRNNLSDPFDNYNGDVEIDLHGQSTLYFPKQSYGVTLLDAAHNKISAPIMGMPSGKDWVLKALYQDKTLMRDALAFRLYSEMGHYSSRNRYFELVVDGDYKGVYQMEEKIRRDNDRVDISKLKISDTTGDDITGGYIVRLDKRDPSDEGWYSNYNSNITHDSADFWLYYYPKADSMPQSQKNYIKNYINTFENVMAGSGFNDPVNGYNKYLDVNSFIDNFIINEVSKNTDGYRSSAYFYKDRDSKGGKFTSGPVWDYNIAFDNCNFNGGDSPYGWQYQVFATELYVPFWWWQLMSDETFKNNLKCRYQYLRSNSLSVGAVNHYIDSLATYLNESQARNFTRWPILGQQIPPNPTPVPPNYTAELVQMKNFIQQRLTWMDSNLPGICQVGINESESGDNMMNVYPNPFTNSVTLSYSITGNANVKIELLNVMGEQIQLVTDAVKTTGQYEEELKTEGLATGIYMVKLTVDKQVSYKKIVKI